MNRIAIGFYGALAASAGVLLMPFVVLVTSSIVEGYSLSKIMDEPESRGFVTLYLVIVLILHLPMATILALFAYAVHRGSTKALWVFYVLSLPGMGLGILCYLVIPVGLGYTRLLPAVLYLLVVLPLLTQSLSACTKAQKPARQGHI